MLWTVVTKLPGQALLQFIFELIIKHAEGDHRLAEQMCAGDHKRLEIREQVESFVGAGNRVRQNLSGQVRNIDAVP